jgi:spoIIIJ-associated protein
MEAKKEKRSTKARAKNVELAIEKALAELGISRIEAQISVLKEGSRGVLGIGAEDAEVQVDALPIPVVKSPAQSEPPARGESKPPADVEPEHEYPPLTDAADRNRAAAVARETLAALLGRMGISAHVELLEQTTPANNEEHAISLNVTGDDLGALIGRRGETLEDLQFITRLIVSRQIQRWPNIIVDVEYYRARREKLLADLARRMAERVRLTKQSVALEPMPANERRIVHLTLRDFPGVFTESTGEGQGRKVMILPKP